MTGTAQVSLTVTASPEEQWQTAQLALQQLGTVLATVCPGFFSPSDAPGTTPDAGWEGHIRATKQRAEAGDGHKVCTGKAWKAVYLGLWSARTQDVHHQVLLTLGTGSHAALR